MKLESALHLAELGFRVFPLLPNSKRPAIDAWPAKATADKAIIQRYWTANPDHNIGVATGGDFFVIDVDTKDGRPGLQSLDSLVLMYDVPLHTYNVRTPTGGMHIYLTKPIDLKLVSNSDRVIDHPGLDIRAEGGFVVAAGSTIDGVAYKDEIYAIASAPDCFFPLLRKPMAERANDNSIELDQPNNIKRATDYLLHIAPTAVEGDAGDTTTFSVAAELRALGVSEHIALDLMLEHWNERCSPPWDPEELETKVSNGFGYGQGAPGGKTAQAEFDIIDIDVGIPPSRTSGTRKSKMHFLTYEEMTNLPEPEWLVDNVIQKRSAALLFGKSNTFKSFLAIDIGLSIATGRPWHGNATKQGRVLFVATEGANGVGRLRIPGWFDHYGINQGSLRQNAYLYPKEICLDLESDVTALIEAANAIGDFTLITFDIFGGTMIGAETEDTTARAWTRHVQRIMRETGSATLTVAHTGWQDETRARMHTHFWGSFDSRMRVEGDKDKMQTCLTIERHKDADSSGQWGFKMERVGETLVPLFDGSVVANKGAGLKGAQLFAMRALDEAVEEHGILQLGEKWPDCKIVDISHWRDACFDAGITTSDSPEARKKAFQRAREGLQEKGLIDLHEGFVWSTFDAK